jgi:hypothetical protein
MNVVEVILLAGGIAVFIASYFVGNRKDEDDAEESEPVVNRELTEADKAKIEEQVDSIIQNKMEDVTEQTEAKMDKISNTKILELNDYAQTIMNEINKNHNETVFLYDMLNEKAKEVRNTVKDVNIARKEVDKIASRTVSQPAEPETNEESKETKENKEVKSTGEANVKAAAKKPAEPVKNTGAGLNNQIDTSLYTNINKVSDGNNEYGYKVPTGSKDLAKERLIEIMKNSSKTQAEESARAKAKAKAKEEPPKPKTGLEQVSRKPAAEQTTKASAEVDETAETQIVAELAGDIGRTAKAGNIEEDVKTEINDDDSAGMSAQAGAMEVPDGTVELSAKPAAEDLAEKPEEEKPAKSKSVKKVSRRSVTKKAAGSQAGELVKMTAPKVEDIVAGFDEYMTNSDKIMELSKQGVSNKEIAKVLNVGLGEVKLVVDLLNSSD